MSTRTAAETSLETPKYSILKLVPPGGDARADLCSLIRLAKDTERYDDMGALSRALVILAKGALSKEERKLFITAHTQCLAAKRAAWRTMHAEPSSSNIGKAYRAEIEAEIVKYAKALNDFVLSEILTRDTIDVEQRVAFLKLVADSARYMYEVQPSVKQHLDLANTYYSDATEVARDLAKQNAVRLGLILNYSVFMFETLNDPKRGYATAKVAFDDAINGLDELDEEEYRESAILLQLIRDNMALWVSLDQRPL